MLRLRKSLLNDWVKKQPGTQDYIAAKLDILPGTLKAWLFLGYVPKKNIETISEKTGIPADKLMSEYMKRGS
jgi:hypothetical protein